MTITASARGTGSKHRTLLLMLGILLAADIISTIALNPTLEIFLALGLLVVVRTFLSWSLVVNIEACWPWQSKKARC